MVVGLLGAIKPNHDEMLKSVGTKVTPIFQPMGIKEDNWQAVVSLMAGMMAKEVVVGSLTALYAQELNPDEIPDSVDTIYGCVEEAFTSIKTNALRLKDAVVNPLMASSPDQTMENKILGVLYLKFDSAISAFAYLLFVLLYFPCVSVVAVMARELSHKWAVFSVFWSTSMAYMVAVLFYQVTTFKAHPATSMGWLMGIPLAFAIMLFLIHLVMKDDSKSQPLSIPTKIMLTS